ncbi:hypothetical protein [Kitasatospora sp. NPDC004531]
MDRTPTGDGTRKWREHAARIRAVAGDVAAGAGHVGTIAKKVQTVFAAVVVIVITVEALTDLFPSRNSGAGTT